MARMPQEICAPSKAGPAAVEVVSMSPLRASTISPLVPMSIESVVFFSCARSSATIMPMVSAPTYAEMSGRVSTYPFSWKVQP